MYDEGTWNERGMLGSLREMFAVHSIQYRDHMMGCAVLMDSFSFACEGWMKPEVISVSFPHMKQLVNKFCGT